MSKKHVLFAQLTAEGGSYASLRDLVHDVKEQGYSVYLLLGRSRRGSDPFFAEFVGVTQTRLGQISNHTYTQLRRLFVSLPNFFFRLPWDILYVMWIIRRDEIEVVHINVSNLVSVGIASRLAGVRVVWHIREVINDNILGRAHVRAIEHLSNVILCNSSVTSQRFSQRARVVPNGIRFENIKIAESREQFRESFSTIHGTVVTMAATLTRKLARSKGFYFFIDVAAYLDKTYPDLCITYWIVGDDEYAKPPHDEKTALKNYAAENGVLRHCRFLGYQKEIFAVFNASDIVICPNLREEGFGRTIIEAGAVGCPVVASDLSPNDSLVVDRTTGIVVRAGDRAAFGEAICSLAIDAELRQAMGKKAKQHIRHHYDQRKLSRIIMSFYSSDNTRVNR